MQESRQRNTECEALRSQFYNATVIARRLIHDQLMVLRVQTDAPVDHFAAGQYTVLGLGFWEPRVTGCQAEGDISDQLTKLIKRAYSVSCPLVSQAGELVGVNDLDFLEFYIALVQHGTLHPPALTPRLFVLQEQDRLYCGPHFHGHYCVDAIPSEMDIVFAATGTGEAPHNAMIAQLLKSTHQGSIVHLCCTRWKKDLAYLEQHRQLERRYENYRYVGLTTREPENLDSSLRDYVGKRYLQQYLASGDLTRETGLLLDPDGTHVFLCGNPQMIGLPSPSDKQAGRYPRPQGMIETLVKLGFEIDRPHEPGNIHFESYW